MPAFDEFAAKPDTTAITANAKPNFEPTNTDDTETPTISDLRDRLDAVQGLVLLLHAALGNRDIGPAGLNGGQHLCDLVASEIDAVDDCLGRREQKKAADAESLSASIRAESVAFNEKFIDALGRLRKAKDALEESDHGKEDLAATYNAALAHFADVEPVNGRHLKWKLSMLRELLTPLIDPEKGAGAMNLLDAIERDSMTFAVPW